MLENKIHFSKIVLKAGVIIFLLICFTILILYGAYKFTLYQDSKIYQLHTKDKITIENALSLYSKKEYHSPYNYIIGGLDYSNVDYYWVRYSILGIMPIYVIYNKGHKCMMTIARYE